MKKSFTFLIAVLLTVCVYAQAPQKMSYQAVIRDASNNLVTSHAIGMRISILQGSVTGTPTYVETQTLTTNTNGLVTAEIGSGTIVSGIFVSIDWANGPYFIKSETDPTGGTNYTISGTSQLLSVPYALHAKTAENGFSGIYSDLTGKPVLWDSTYASIKNKPNLFDGQYSSLTGNPNLSNVATSGSYNDLSNKPTLFSGIYSDLTGKPVLWDSTWNSIKNKPTLFDGQYSSLSGKPNLSTIATSGSYNDLTNKPTLFSGVYTDLTGKPVLWDSTWASIKNKPVFFDGQYNSLSGKPTFSTIATSGSYNDLANKPTLFSGVYTDLTGKPVLWDSTWNSIKNKPILFDGQYISLTGKPTFSTVATSGSYTDLNNKPSLSTVATSGSYNDLTNKPTGNNIGDIQYWNGTSWVIVPVGQPGQYLQLSATNMPTWTGTTYPTITTSIVTTSITTASCGGNITSDGGATVIARGVCWSNSQNPTISNSHTSDGTGTGSFISSITGLTSSTLYYIRAYATNSLGTTYGMQLSFTTNTPSLPTVATSIISNINTTTATGGGNVTDDGGSTVTACGICWSTSQNPTISNSHTSDGTGTGSFISSITGLISSTLYYIRAYATNNVGISYGNQFSFTTQSATPSTVTDIDGNIYDTVVIGSQTWLKQNLNVTHYRNGNAIPNVSDNTAWSNLTTGAYCDYNNIPGYSITYGRLYNFYTVFDTRNLCPTGWHVPSDAEWTTLTTYLGGESIAGGKLKEAGLSHWISPNTAATNETVFTALPGGYRSGTGAYNPIGYCDYWWSSTQDGNLGAWYRQVGNTHGYANRGHSYNQDGFSVRCLHD